MANSGPFLLSSLSTAQWVTLSPGILNRSLHNDHEITEQRHSARDGEKQVGGGPTTWSWKTHCFMGKRGLHLNVYDA